MINRGQNSRRLGARTDVAGVLVLQADDHATRRGLFGKAGERLDNSREARLRLDGPPVREYANDSGLGARRNFESSRRQSLLIGERVFGREGILLKSLIH